MTQIQKLAEKAKKSVPQGILTPDKWIEEYNKKFAELIVRECADFVDQNTLEDQGMWGKIMRHFGIVE